jgi:hypothetical protein
MWKKDRKNWVWTKTLNFMNKMEKISRKEDSKKEKHDRRKDVQKDRIKKIVRKVEELQRENILLKESKKQERHI